MPQKPILVTSYVNPDLDGVACMLAYVELLSTQGKKVVAGFMGEMHGEALYVLNRFSITTPPPIKNTNVYDKVILVDVSEINNLEGNVQPKKVIEIIDHRMVNQVDKFPNAIAQVELVGAAATLIAEKFVKSATNISQKSAILLYAAIISNTLNFKSSVTTERDYEASKWLNSFAKLPLDFWKELFVAKSDLSGDKLGRSLIGDFAHFDMGNHKLGISQIEIIGANDLIDHRGSEIIAVLDKLKTEMKLDFVFLNLVELDGEANFFVTADTITKKLLEKALHINFVKNIARRTGLILRKQLVPILKEAIEIYA